MSVAKNYGYRSPCFSQNEFIADALEKNGFEYSSMSIESTFHDRYEQTHLSVRTGFKISQCQLQK